MTADTAVIVVNWNGARLLPACLSALAAQSYRDYDLWLVDNGSIDASGLMLADLERSRHAKWLTSAPASAPAALMPSLARVIRNKANLGFAVGNNQAMRLCLGQYKYVALLNNDAIADVDWLGNLVETAGASEPTMGMVASTMLFSHAPHLAASAGISVHTDGVALDRGVGLPSRALERAGTVPVFGPSAGAALYKSAMLRDVGLFDERFFSYLEDADLAWRARGRGWRALHNPHARVLHEYSATGGHNSPFKRALLSRNRVWLLYKNMPTPLLIRFAPLIMRYDTLALLNAVLQRDVYSIKGRMQALAALPLWAESRRKTITSARLHPSEMRRLLAPALDPRQVLKYRKRINLCLKEQQPE